MSKKIDINKLIESCFEISTSDPDQVDEMLREHGYDPDKTASKGVLKIKQLLFQQTVAAKKTAMGNLYSRAVSLIQNAQDQSKEVIFSILRQKSPSLQFRNLEKLDDESLQQILTDTEILELIDKLENENKK